MTKRLLIFISLLVLGVSANGQTTDLRGDGTLSEGLRGLSLDLRGRLYATGFADPRSGRPSVVHLDTHTGKVKMVARLTEGVDATALVQDRKGELYVLDAAGKQILQIKGARVKVFAALEGMQAPVNMALTPRGYIYVTDRGAGKRGGVLWMVRPTGDVVRLEEKMGAVSGVAVSPDGGKLYVAEARQRHLWAYDIKADGRVEGKRLVCRFEGFGVSGVGCDHEGNIYVGREGKGTVEVLTPEGEPWREVRLRGFRPGNICVGDGVIYVTVSDRGTVELAR